MIRDRAGIRRASEADRRGSGAHATRRGRIPRKVIPKQTGPDLRGFGHQAMPLLWGNPALQVVRRAPEVSCLQTAFHLNLGLGLGTSADPDEATPSGSVRAGRAVLPPTIWQHDQRCIDGALLPSTAPAAPRWSSCRSRSRARSNATKPPLAASGRATWLGCGR